MSLPKGTKKEPRPIPLTVRISETAMDQLKILANAHDLSQADVIEHLIKEEYDDFNKKKKKSSLARA